MRKINVKDKDDNINIVNIYDCYDMPVDRLLDVKYLTAKRNSKIYLDVISTFDIETTTIIKHDVNEEGNETYENSYAYMYQWQYCIGGEVCFGRTWEEFGILLNRIHDIVSIAPTIRLVTYVHFLSYELTFLREFVSIKDVWALDKHKPLRVDTYDGIEFRCSYLLSNMKLSKFCQSQKDVKYYKRVDEYDYDKIRTSKTPLTEDEEGYCYCDVMGLYEAICALLQDYSDTLFSVPTTSTGYIRREARKIMLSNPDNRKLIRRMALTKESYIMCREAFRGGDTGANTYAVDEILEEVDSWDKKSSYPASMLYDMYPMTKFCRVTCDNRDNFERWITTKACLMRIVIADVHQKNLCSIPYISGSRCTGMLKPVINNGRVVSAKRLYMTITDIDWKIITEEYDIYGGIVVTDMYIAEYGYLPKEYREFLVKIGQEKQLLGDRRDNEKKHSEKWNELNYEYSKYKNKYNSLYGMMVTDITRPEILYNDAEWKDDDVDIEDALERYYKSPNSFLSYQWGIWVTANARKRLRDALHRCDRTAYYCDTDSVKGNVDADIFCKLNEEIRNTVHKLDIDAVIHGKNGNVYLGQWEHEEHYRRMKILGSKKYLVEYDDEKMELTLAGVNKTEGTKYFEEKGFCAFTDGHIIPHKYSKRTSAVYHDRAGKHTIIIDGVSMTTGSSVALIPGDYTFNIRGEYKDAIKSAKDYAKKIVDNNDSNNYN